MGDRSPATGLAASDPEAVTLVIDAVAALPASTLTCGGEPTARIPAPSSMRLRLVLVDDGNGYRINSQWRS